LADTTDFPSEKNFEVENFQLLTMIFSQHFLSVEIFLALKWALIPKPYPYRFMIDLKEEQSNEYLKKVSAMAQRAGCQVNIVRYLFPSAMVFV
jgi:hypothetical protein